MATTISWSRFHVLMPPREHTEIEVFHVFLISISRRLIHM
jgi:hypothetical protein